MDRNIIIAEAISRITNSILREQSDGEFCHLLKSYGLEDLAASSVNYFFDTQKNGNIILFGHSKVNRKQINGILKSLGISKNRFEHVEYDDVTNYNFKDLEYNSNYRLILLGPMPHSAKGMGDNKSIIEWIQNNENIAKSVKLDNLKVSKTSLKKAISDQIKSGYLLKG